MSSYCSIDTLLIHFLSSTGVSTDSRNITDGQLFFALKGPSFDGNRYAAMALEQGAGFVVVDDPDVVNGDRYLLVEDALGALQELATRYRETLECKVIAVAGSNGKTTTKQLTGLVLETTFPTFSTPGNFNNHIGVPLSVLSIKPDQTFAVLELGANHLGETAFLCEICQPEYGVVTNCGLDHLEGYGSLEGVIAANCEVYEYLKTRSGTVFVNSDDEVLMERSEGIDRVLYGTQPLGGAHIVQGSIEASFPFLSARLSFLDEPHVVVQTSLFGDVFLTNVLCAAAIGRYFEVPVDAIVQSIHRYTPSNNRSQFLKWGSHQVLLDAYNANPSSVEGMVSTFARLEHPFRGVFLGDMLELGEYSDSEHQRIADLVGSFGFEMMWFIGPCYGKATLPDGAQHFDTIFDARDFLDANPVENGFFLIKGSRSLTMEKLIDVIP